MKEFITSVSNSVFDGRIKVVPTIAVSVYEGEEYRDLECYIYREINGEFETEDKSEGIYISSDEIDINDEQSVKSFVEFLLADEDYFKMELFSDENYYDEEEEDDESNWGEYRRKTASKILNDYTELDLERMPVADALESLSEVASRMADFIRAGFDEDALE